MWFAYSTWVSQATCSLFIRWSPPSTLVELQREAADKIEAALG